MRYEVMTKNVVEIFGGIPGVGKTKLIDELFKNNPDIRKIYLALSHKQVEEREDFLTGMELTHWYGMPLTCPIVEQEPVKTFLEVNMPTRWICRICQSLKLYPAKACPHKLQFKNPENTVIAPVAYTFTEHVEKYKPEIVVVDDIILQKHDLPTRNEMKKYAHSLYQTGFCDYKTFEDLFEEQGEKIEQYILHTIEPKLKAGIKRLLDEGGDFSKESAKILLQIDPITLLDWYRLVKVYGWQEEFSIPLLMPVFQLALHKDRRIIVVGAEVNKPFLEMMIKCFQKEYGYPITLQYRTMELNSHLPDSVVYRVRSPKYDNAWYPTTTSIVKSGVTRLSIKQRIETILLEQVDEPKKLSNLTVGIIKPKKAPLTDFLTPVVEHYCRIESLDFGSLRSSNTLEHCNILFVIGTYNVNINSLQKDFVKFYHRNPWSVESVKQRDGGYQYVADGELENFRGMTEDYEMYQAIHRCRPALRQRKIFVFGLPPKEIYDEFKVEDLTFEKNSGVMYLVEWESFDKWMMEQIGEKGMYHGELVKRISEKFGINKSSAWQRIQKFAEEHNDEYEIGDKKIGDMRVKYVRKV